MLLFSTILDINPTMTADAFIKLVIRWNKESNYASNIIPDLEWHGEKNIRYGTDLLWLDIEEYRKQNIIAVCLKGVAHVLVQEDIESNATLKEMCVANNDYLGAIGVYFPGEAVGYRRYPYRGIEGIDRFIMEKVIRAVIQYSNAQLLDTMYTWPGVFFYESLA